MGKEIRQDLLLSAVRNMSAAVKFDGVTKRGIEKYAVAAFWRSLNIERLALARQLIEERRAGLAGHGAGNDPLIPGSAVKPSGQPFRTRPAVAPEEPREGMRRGGHQ